MRLVIIPAIALLVLGAVFLLWPDGDDGGVVTSEARKFTVCNVTVPEPADDPENAISISPTDRRVVANQLRVHVPDFVDLPEQAAIALANRMEQEVRTINNQPVADVISIRHVRSHNGVFTEVYVDALTGERIAAILPPQAEADIQRVEAVAAGAEVVDPASRKWPYSSAGSTGRKGSDLLSWREPDHESGLQVQEASGAGPEGGGEAITLAGCRSAKTLVVNQDGSTEVTLDSVAPEDREAFDAFFAEVVTGAP